MSWETHDAHHVTPISIISALISSIGFRLCTHSAITTHHSPGIHHQSSPHVACWSVPAAGILTLGKGGEYYETLKPHKVPKWLNSKLFMRNFRGGNLHSHLGGPWGSRSQVKSIRCKLVTCRISSRWLVGPAVLVFLHGLCCCCVGVAVQRLEKIETNIRSQLHHQHQIQSQDSSPWRLFSLSILYLTSHIWCCPKWRKLRFSR